MSARVVPAAPRSWWVFGAEGHIGPIRVACGCGAVVVLRRHLETYECGCGRFYRRKIEQIVEIDDTSRDH